MAKYKEYKHLLVLPETHQKLRVFIAQNKLKSFDQAINNFIEGSNK